MRISDMARSAYTGFPRPLKDAFAPIVGLIPNRLRYGQTFERWSADIRRSRNEPDFAVERAERQLRALLTKAATGSSFWRNVIGDRDVRSFRLEDVANLPVTTKDMLRAVGSAARVDRPPRVVDAIEALGVDPADVAPDHWRHVHNRISVNEPFRAYGREQHRAWLRRRELLP